MNKKYSRILFFLKTKIQAYLGPTNIERICHILKFLTHIISPCDSGWSCRGELFITVFAIIDEGGKGWHERLC